MVKKAYKYRFYPTQDQIVLLAKTFGCIRYIYNTVLRWRTDEYYKSKARIRYNQTSSKLTEIKQDTELSWLREVSSVPLQQCLRHQQSAFKNFFEKRTKYPKYKKKINKQSCTLVDTAFLYRDNKLYIAKCKESLDIVWSQKLPCKPSSITISKDSANRYFVSCLCEVDIKPLKKKKTSIGIDLGIKHLFVTDKGSKFSNHKYTAKYEDKLAKKQKALSKKKLGSKNRNKARISVAKVHNKISDSRKDYIHKLTRKLINENQVICCETLKVKNMIRNPKLSKSIADANWGEFTRQLEYKAEWYGRTFVKIDQFFPSSKRCSKCGYIVNTLPLDIRNWTCAECNSAHDRDINAAKNIKAAGHAVLAFGENVNLKRDLSRESCFQ